MSDLTALAALDPEELELQRRFVAGDREAFGLLVEPHLDTLYTACLRLMSSAAQAEDAAQEALVSAMRNHHGFTVGRPLRPWLLTIARNRCRSTLRGPWWRRVLPLDTPQVSPDNDPEYVTVALDSDAKVRRALMTLPEYYREALALFHLQDMSYAEMSEITGVGVPALKQRVRRGSALLREKVQKLYPELDRGRTSE